MLHLRSDVHRVNRKGVSTDSCGAPVLQTTTSDAQSRSLTNSNCGLKSVVHTSRWQSTPAPFSFLLSSDGYIVLRALERSENMTLTVLPEFARCERDLCIR